MNKYGLIGRNIGYSFSKKYFSKKFKNLGIDATYENFDQDNLSQFKETILQINKLKGLNVTIPFKKEIIHHLDSIDDNALEIGAVNTLKIQGGKVIGFNTDWIGFTQSLLNHKKPFHKEALILGTGGASLAIAYALHKLNIPFKYVSRKAQNKNDLAYLEITSDIIKKHLLIINCTPLGTYPDINTAPALPYHFVGKNHLLYDLVYNPAKTLFMKNGIKQGANVVNGMEMLMDQAEESWRIWNSM